MSEVDLSNEAERDDELIRRSVGPCNEDALDTSLRFLEAQLIARPDLISPLTEAGVAGLDDLLDGVANGDDVDWDEFELP